MRGRATAPLADLEPEATICLEPEPDPEVEPKATPRVEPEVGPEVEADPEPAAETAAQTTAGSELELKFVVDLDGGFGMGGVLQ